MEIQYLPGVGPKRAELLRKELAVETVGDLLRLYPFRYIDKSTIVRICDARPDMAYLQVRAKVLRVDLYGAQGLVADPARATNQMPGSQNWQNGNQISYHNNLPEIDQRGPQTYGQSTMSQGAVQQASSQMVATHGAVKRGDKTENGLKFNTIRRMSVWVGDGSGEMEMVFFKGIKWMYEKLKPGAEFVFFGKPTAFNGKINMVHPEVDAAGSPTRPGTTGNQGTMAGNLSNPAGQAGTTGNQGIMAGNMAGMVGQANIPGGQPGMVGGQANMPGNQRSWTGNQWMTGGQPTATGTMTGQQTTGSTATTYHPTATGTMTGQPTRNGSASTYQPTIAGQSTMTGVYTSTERLKNAGVTGKVMSKIMKAALERGLAATEETMPEYLMKQCGLVPLHFALRNIHFPKDMAALEKAKYRLKFEELFYLQLSLLKQKYVRSRADQGIAMPRVGDAFNACYNALPFPLTGAQKRVITEIRNDMKSGHQMNRLLQGDVGSGKTMVAVLTALIAIGNGFQACIMAPTEVLAQQHFKNIQKFLAPTGVKSALLTGSSKTSERREIHAGLEDGSIGIIVGTHALIEDNVIFRNLGLAIVDEQHRFGVEQRSKLWRKASCGAPPHVLVMTATPIPRTLAMTLYGDLDVSVIDELPPGRKPVQTIHATEGKRPAMYRFMKEEIAKGRQIFIVYPLINETEKLDYQSLEAGAEEIMNKFPFPEYKTAVVHGKQLNDVKKFNMDAFAEGRADILVATSVIEVGVDVPNASVMIIESAERFGLSQLHQLRGRVGRGSEKSYCILMTGHKMSKESKHRIELMCATENGFELAEEDMKMRGPGDLEGTQQSGLPISLNISSLAKDGLILRMQCLGRIRRLLRIGIRCFARSSERRSTRLKTIVKSVSSKDSSTSLGMTF